MQRKDLPVVLNLVKAVKGLADEDRCVKEHSSADLIKSICHIIGLKDIACMDKNVTLGSLGIDSLIAIEIKQTLERTKSLSLSLKEIRDLTIDKVLQLAA